MVGPASRAGPAPLRVALGEGYPNTLAAHVRDERGDSASLGPASLEPRPADERGLPAEVADGVGPPAGLGWRRLAA